MCRKVTKTDGQNRAFVLPRAGCTYILARRSSKDSRVVDHESQELFLRVTKATRDDAESVVDRPISSGKRFDEFMGDHAKRDR